MDKQEIRALFDKAGASISQDDVWEIQKGVPVIKHKAVERLGAALKIRFQAPHILRAERDEAVILSTGTLGEVSEWSIGEACVNVNYKVVGKMSAYVYAMAEKRSRDRVILKLAGLHGVYSEEEADEFKSNNEAPSASSSDTYFKLALSVVDVAKTAHDLEEWWVKEAQKRHDMLDDLQRQTLKKAVGVKGKELKEKENVSAKV